MTVTWPQNMLPQMADPLAALKQNITILPWQEQLIIFEQQVI
jgi:hypothetical protein